MREWVAEIKSILLIQRYALDLSSDTVQTFSDASSPFLLIVPDSWASEMQPGSRSVRASPSTETSTSPLHSSLPEVELQRRRRQRPH